MKDVRGENTCAQDAESGKKAFFIRVEKIDAGFDQAFEIGTAEEFAVWIGSTEEAWLFLDSVDDGPTGR